MCDRELSIKFSVHCWEITLFYKEEQMRWNTGKDRGLWSAEQSKQSACHWLITLHWKEESISLIIWKGYVQMNHILIGFEMYMILSSIPVSQTYIFLVWWRIETQVICEEEQQFKHISPLKWNRA